jgi:hypothetical protein
VPDVTDGATSLTQLGIAGFFIISCIGVIRVLWLELKETSKGRREDADKYAASLLAVIREYQTSVSSNTKSTDTLGTGVETLGTTLKEVVQSIRK